MPGRGSLVFLLALAVATGPTAAQELVVIVHVDRRQELSRSELAQIFLKRRRFWSDGQPILPVNRESGSPARELFSRMVFGEDAPDLGVYWNRQYFRGVLPPATLASDEAVRRFVAGEPRAIGYVAPRTADASVRVVLRLGAP